MVVPTANKNFGASGTLGNSPKCALTLVGRLFLLK